jgi:hypothetical protein
MKRLRLASVVAKMLLLALVAAGIASAQASRTWVSGVGDDANPCSRTAPCKTFAGAISKTAAGGEINCLDPAGFGGVTITKAMTIDCTGTYGSVLVAGTNGIVVAAGSSDVIIIRGLSLNGLYTPATAGNAGINGILYNSGLAVHLYNVFINRFGTACIAQNTGTLTVDDSNLDECIQSGISVTNGTASVNNTRIAHSGYGVQQLAGNTVNLRNSHLSNSGIGVVQTAAGAQLIASANQFSSNGTAVQSVAGSTMFLYGNVFGQNATAMNPAGGTISSDGQNAVAANGANGVPNGGAASKQ